MRNTRYRPCLDVRVTFPITAVLLQIIFEAIETDCHPTAVAERTQTHVDAKHKSINRLGCKQMNYALCEPQKKFRVFHGAIGIIRPRLTVLWIEKDQIDVGREIQFASTQFAHA